MPPKPRPLRKGSTASSASRSASGKDAAAPSSASASNQASKSKSPSKAAMPPPPPPGPTTILGPEMQALEQSLKEAALNTGQIFRFYADTRKERIASHAPYPPRSIARALGRSLERYDRMCDTVETQLLHAISVLERDLKVEQTRIEAEASASVATRTRSKRPSLSPTATRIPLPNTSPPPPGSESQTLTDSPTSMHPPSQFPPPSGASATSIAPRRPSTILSSLHRPSFPLKLDLSPAALAAGNVDSSAMGPPMDVNVDLGLTSLPSPVTLAPKTARPLPNDPNIPDIFGVAASQSMAVNAPDGSGPGDAGPMSGAVGMKTTGTVQEDVIDLTGPEPSRDGVPAQLGDSADKPIELDLEGNYDDMDLFGDVQTNDSTNPVDPNVHASGGAGAQTQLDVDMEELFTPQDNQTNAFQLDEAMGQSINTGASPDPRAILASLASNVGPSGSSTNELSSLLPDGNGQSGNNNTSDGLPGQASGDPFPGLGSEGVGTQFDISGLDLSSFSGLFDAPEDTTGGDTGVGGEEEMDLMSQLLAMDGGENVNSQGDGGNAGS